MLHPDLDTNALREEFAAAEPFGYVVIDQFLDEERVHEVSRALPSYREALSVGTSFKTVNEDRKVQVEDSERFPPAVRELHEFLNGTQFLETLGHITGIDELKCDPKSTGGGIHQTGRGGRLDVHVDFNYLPDLLAFRRLNLLLYLNPEWDETWGGQLELWDQDVKTCLQSVLPTLNRCLIFETNDVSYHGVTRVTCPLDQARKSYSAYYYTHAAPPGFHDNFHGTVFKARPTEFWKGLLWMPLENLMHRWKLKR